MADAYEYADALVDGRAKGRGAGLNPGNRFEPVRLHVLGERLDELQKDPDTPGAKSRPRTEVFRDDTQTIINRVDPESDTGMTWTVNPYRGCEHGCIYCYARPYHEYLGFSCGIDFETKIMAKLDAPELLERELARPKWVGEAVVMSGITDCWQPIEAELTIARRCLAVMARCRQPVGLITKNRLIERDLDLIKELNRYQAIHVAVSLTSLDNKLAAKMEPRASAPGDRLHAIRALSEAGVPVTVMTAPIVPGLNDRELPKLLEAAADAGARSAGYVLLRLPWQIKALFMDWLKEHFPDRAQHVESLLRGMHYGKLYDATKGVRRRGEGPVAAHIAEVFKVFKKRYHLDRGSPPLSSEHFRRPDVGGQGWLFGG